MFLNDFNGQKFDKHQLESLNYVKDIVRNNGGIIFDKFKTNSNIFKSKM